MAVNDIRVWDFKAIDACQTPYNSFVIASNEEDAVDTIRSNGLFVVELKERTGKKTDEAADGQAAFEAQDKMPKWVNILIIAGLVLITIAVIFEVASRIGWFT